MMLTGCVASAPAPDRGLSAAVVRPFYPRVAPGPEAMRVLGECQRVADYNRPDSTTIVGEAYHRSFNKACILSNGVPPEYVMVLTPY